MSDATGYHIKVKLETERTWRFLAESGTTRSRVKAIQYGDLATAVWVAGYVKLTAPGRVRVVDLKGKRHYERAT